MTFQWLDILDEIKHSQEFVNDSGGQASQEMSQNTASPVPSAKRHLHRTLEHRWYLYQSLLNHSKESLWIWLVHFHEQLQETVCTGSQWLCNQIPRGLCHEHHHCSSCSREANWLVQSLWITVRNSSDQGLNFMSKLLKEIYSVIGVKPLRTSPYHLQTDGLVERYN